MEALNLLLLITHVLGACLLVGIVFFSFLAVVQRKFSKDQLVIFTFIRQYGALIAASQFITGLALVSLDWGKFGHNPFVWIKLVLFTLDGYLAFAFLARHPSSYLKKESYAPREVRKFQQAALFSLIVITTVAILGVVLTETA